MKVQNVNNYMNYKQTAKTIKNEEHTKANNYDVIEIKNKGNVNKGNGPKETLTLDAIKKNAVSQINKETDNEKINRIKDSINNKTYSIDVNEIVNKLLK